MIAPLISTVRFEAMDLILVTGPLAGLMILAEMFSYWRFGRRPASAASRASLAVGIGGPAMVGGFALMYQWHPAALLIIGGMLILWVLQSYGRTTSPISRLARVLLVGLRTIVILLLLVYLLQPTLYSVVHFYEKATMLVVYDTTKSMTTKDAGPDGQATRAAAVRDAIAANTAKFTKLGESFDVRQFVLDERGCSEVADPAKPLQAPSLETTALGLSIRDACRQAQGQKIGGIILFTDGADNAVPAGDALRVAEDLGRMATPVAIWPVGVGAEKPPANRPVAVIKELSLSDHKIPAFNVLGVHAVYELINLPGPGQPVHVELVFGQGPDAKVVDSRVIAAGDRSASELVSVDMQVTPSVAGFHAVTVRVAEGSAAKDGTPLASQFGERTDYVQVDDDLIQVLYVEGKFRTEAQYIISAVAGSDLIRLNRQFVLGADVLAGGAASAWPKSPAEWQKYHVIILGDVKANVFSAEELKTIRKMVQEMGKGMVMLGGRDNFGQGGWPDTPIADLMPFDLHQAVGQIPDAFKMQATPQGLDHPLMQLVEPPTSLIPPAPPTSGTTPPAGAQPAGREAVVDKPVDNARAWAMLPPMQGANRFPDAAAIVADHAGAIILAKTPGGQPVMVAQQSGKGRVLAIGIDTTWRWRLHINAGAKWHDHFWRQAVLWLANRDATTWVRCEQPRYRLITTRKPDGGEERIVRDKILVTASMVQPSGKPVGAAGKPTLTLVRPDGKSDEPIDMSTHLKGDLFQIELPRPPTAGGNYKLVFTGEMDGKAVKSETSFLVETIDLEMAPPGLANYPLLRQMAGATKSAGGEFYELKDLGKLLDRFKSSDYLIRLDKEDKDDLADANRWPILIAILALLMVEWMVRKRSSLV